jgi:hypothetical protein
MFPEKVQSYMKNISGASATLGKNAKIITAK